MSDEQPSQPTGIGGNGSSDNQEPPQVTQEFHAPTTGVAGKVEGDQNINVSNSETLSNDLRGASITDFVNQVKIGTVSFVRKPVGIAIVAITATVGIVGIIFSNLNYLNVEGNIESGATVANELTIYEGDPPEVRQRKLEQAKRLIAAETLTNIANLDARLEFVETALAEDNFGEQLQDVRNRVAPTLNQTAASGYRQLMLQQAVSSLRGAFASRPLYEVREPLIQVLIEGDADAERVKAFYNSLTEVQDVSESLFQELSTAASQTSTNPEVLLHNEKRVKLAVDRLVNRSEIAHLHGLMVLDSLNIPLPEAQERLSTLQYLEPRHLISSVEATQLLAEQLEEAKRLLAERAAIVKEAETLRDIALDEYAQLNESLVINPSDSWNVVVGKAISLRQLGRTPEAVAAFSRYGEMFAEKDATAMQYSRTAQQFTLQLNKLDVEGGVYLYEIVPSGAADQADLKVGDIIIGYGNKSIVDMNDITTVLQDTPLGHSVRLTYLRVNSAGAFQSQTITINAGPLGAGMMPI